MNFSQGVISNSFKLLSECFLNEGNLCVFPSYPSSPAALQMVPSTRGARLRMNNSQQCPGNEKWRSERTRSCSPHSPPYSGFAFENIRKCCQRFLKTERSSQNWKGFSTDDQKEPLGFGPDLLSTNPSRLLICHSPPPML